MSIESDRNRNKYQVSLIRVIRTNPRFRQPYPARKQLLYYALFDGDGYVSTLFRYG